MSRDARTHDGRAAILVAAPGKASASVRIRLLGQPEITSEGRSVTAPRGAKSWAVLAYLLMADGPPTRSRLADLCFAGAQNPRRALRWTLSDLRRSLQGIGGVAGDPVRLLLPLTTVVDAWQVLDRELDAASLCLGGQLLEGMSFPSSEPLDRWLELERRRLTVACVEALTTAVREAENAGQPERAARWAAELVSLEPYAQPDTP